MEKKSLVGAMIGLATPQVDSAAGFFAQFNFWTQEVLQRGLWPKIGQCFADI